MISFGLPQEINNKIHRISLKTFCRMIFHAKITGYPFSLCELLESDAKAGTVYIIHMVFIRLLG